jgi:FAD-linked oxidoreductase
MKNWSKAIEWHPQQIAYPTSEEEIQVLVQKAMQQGKKIRMIGSGHSFNPLWVTDQILISLDKYQGLVAVDKARLQATVRGGTKLFTLGDLLFEQGMAMENLGDIDVQSLAGTIATGTHGTGLAFGTISTQVRAIRFVNGKGEIVECSESQNVDLFKAAQVSLGVLGVITQITLQCVPAYRLELVNTTQDLNFVLDNLDQLNRDNRNFEFYYFPHATKVWTKTSNLATDQPDKVNAVHYFTEYVLENYIFKVLCELARFVPATNKAVSKISADSIPNTRKVFHSHKIYATQRLVRFNEMEYNVPIEAHGEVLKEIVKTIEGKKFNVHFPVENRVVRKDDIYLSPAYGRDSAYLACHVYNKKDYQPFFKAMEAIFKTYDGRPHWGKLHTLTHQDLVERYPKFEDFQKHRKAHDPNHIFMNAYLERLFND